MSRSIDYYELLHVQPDAPDAVIKASYRTMMQKLKMHPDLGGDAGVASDINAAYHTLSNPARRAAYDQQRQPAQVEPKPAKPAKRRPFSFRTKAKRPEPAPSKDSSSAESEAPEKKPSPSKRAYGRNYSNRVMWTADPQVPSRECQFCSTAHPFGRDVPQTALCKHCDSPLASAKDSVTLQDGKRTLSRLDLERQISICQQPNTSSQLAVTTDLSLSGLKFQSDADLVIDQLIKISSPFCEALGRVAHITKATSGERQFGIEFLTLYFPNTSGSLISTSA